MTIIGPKSHTDFGRYLQSVAERDIDLLLMEEFHIDPRFVEMFADQAGIDGPVDFAGAWHSLNDEHGESDLVLRIRKNAQRIGILIENKIGAHAQPDQDIRYHLRGSRAQEQGRFDHFVTAICAPRSYLDGLPSNSQYEYRISYERLHDWFSAQSGRRAQWRATIFREAIEQGRRGYVMQVHAGKSAFHLAYWNYLIRHYSQFHMRRPTAKGGRSDWIRFKGHGFPKGVTLNHKNDQGVLDLEFQAISVERLAALRTKDWPEGCIAKQTGKSSVLRVGVPRCDFEHPFSEQEDRVRQIMETAVSLARFANLKP